MKFRSKILFCNNNFLFHSRSFWSKFFRPSPQCDSLYFFHTFDGGLKIIENEFDGFDGVDVARNEIRAVVDITRRSEKRESGHLEMTSLFEGERFIMPIDDDENVRSFFDIFDAFIRLSEFIKLFEFRCFFFLGKYFEGTCGEVFLDLIICGDALLDRWEIRKKSWNPLVVDVIIPGLFRERFDNIAGLKLRTNNEYDFSLGRKIFEGFLHFREANLGLVEIEYMNMILNPINIVSHFSGPKLSLVSDMHGIVEHVFYKGSICHNGKK